MEEIIIITTTITTKVKVASFSRFEMFELMMIDDDDD